MVKKLNTRASNKQLKQRPTTSINLVQPLSQTVATDSAVSKRPMVPSLSLALDQLTTGKHVPYSSNITPRTKMEYNSK